MKIVFIRHSEPDYSSVHAKKFIGHGMDLASLTENGIELVEKVSGDKRFNDAELILSSPYTRALQTAAIISKNRRLDIKVELDIHEWIPDLSYQFSTEEEAFKAFNSFVQNKGICPKDSDLKYETYKDVFERAKNVLLKYTSHNKIIIVAHGVLIGCFTSDAKIPYCGIVEVDFDESYACADFNWQISKWND